MATRNNSPQNTCSAEALRQVFETAVVEIHQPDLIKRRLPIVQRHRPAAALKYRTAGKSVRYQMRLRPWLNCGSFHHFQRAKGAFP